MTESLGQHQRKLVALGKTRDEAIELLPPEGWLDACGSLVGTKGREAALTLLADNGCDRGEASLVLTVVAREIEHDNPDAAQRYLRSFLPAAGSETLLLRTLATLVAP